MTRVALLQVWAICAQGGMTRVATMRLWAICAQCSMTRVAIIQHAIWREYVLTFIDKRYAVYDASSIICNMPCRTRVASTHLSISGMPCMTRVASMQLSPFGTWTQVTMIHENHGNGIFITYLGMQRWTELKRLILIPLRITNCHLIYSCPKIQDYRLRLTERSSFLLSVGYASIRARLQLRWLPYSSNSFTRLRTRF